MVRPGDGTAVRFSAAEHLDPGRHHRPGDDGAARPEPQIDCRHQPGHRYLGQHWAELVSAHPVRHLDAARVQRDGRIARALVARVRFLRLCAVRRHRGTVRGAVRAALHYPHQAAALSRPEA